MLGMQVVAPVRETTAQALGMAARALPQPSLTSVAGHLRCLVGPAGMGGAPGGPAWPQVPAGCAPGLRAGAAAAGAAHCAAGPAGAASYHKNMR